MPIFRFRAEQRRLQEHANILRAPSQEEQKLQSIEGLKPYSRSPMPHVSAAALVLLKEAIESKNSSLEVQHAALKAIAESLHPGSARMLGDQLNHESPEVRRKAAHLLAELCKNGNKSAIKILKKTRGAHPDSSVQTIARTATLFKKNWLEEMWSIITGKI